MGIRGRSKAKTRTIVWTLACAILVAIVTPCLADAIAGFCESRGGTIRIDPGGSGHPVAMCDLKDGTSMNAVAFFRNQHRTLK